MKVSRYFLVFALVAACAPRTEVQTVQSTGFLPAPQLAPMETNAPPAVLMVSQFELTPDANTPIFGEAFIIGHNVDRSEDAFGINVVLESVPPGEHAWHIHRGSCAVKNAPVALALSGTADMKGITDPLVADESGSVDVTVFVAPVPGKLTLVDLKKEDYSLHVHQRGGMDHGPSIACATI